jgi:hypothetical protein
MRRSVIVTAVVTSVVSTTLTALVMLALLPAVVTAQVERLTATGLTIQRGDGLQGLVADVRPTGGGIVQVFGPDGTTTRVQLASGGAAPGQVIRPDAPGAGVNVNGVNGTRIARLGTHGVLNDSIMLELDDAQGNARFRAIVDPDGNPTIELMDAEGHVTWSAP